MDYSDMTFEELSKYIEYQAKSLYTNVQDALYPNKSAMTRARKALRELEKAGKAYCKLTVQLSKQPKQAKQ